MSKLKIVLLLAAVLTPLAYWVSFEGSTGALIEENPDLDPAIVRKIHKEMYFETLKGTLDVDDDADGSTGEYNKILRERYTKYTS